MTRTLAATTMNDLRTAAQQALEALEKTHTQPGCEQWQAERKASVALRAALAQQEQEQATVKDPLQVDPKGGMQIATPLPLTTTDLAWLETRRLVRVWQELGQIRWAGADQGWDRAIEAVRARLDKECQDVLAWKEKVEASGQTAAQLLQKLRGVKDE
jgi:hypothetical protein